MTQFRDAHGVQWAVARQWWSIDVPPDYGALGDDIISFVIGVTCMLLWLPFVLAWPFWFLAKLCGVPWTVVVTRDGEKVHTERVRGWSASERRIEQLARDLRIGQYSPHQAEVWSPNRPGAEWPRWRMSRPFLVDTPRPR